MCEKHFEPNMFLNDYRNRLQNTAIPVLCLDAPPPPPRAPRPPNQLKIVGKHLMLVRFLLIMLVVRIALTTFAFGSTEKQFRTTTIQTDESGQR